MAKAIGIALVVVWLLFLLLTIALDAKHVTRDLAVVYLTFSPLLAWLLEILAWFEKRKKRP